MTQQDECDLCHYGNGLTFDLPTVYSINGEQRLNKQTFFGFLNRLDRIKPASSGKVLAEAVIMGFPGTWMTESESVVYRVVPK
ncbi:MAG: hypothetical protein KGZ72_08650, partial [Roseovarius sp.]|nr:hypothetical protein [Roseovarius sp.]